MVASPLDQDHRYFFYYFNNFCNYPFTDVKIHYPFTEEARNDHHCDISTVNNYKLSTTISNDTDANNYNSIPNDNNNINSAVR